MKIFFILLKYEWILSKREINSWNMPLVFFICSSSLFLWIPQNIDKITRHTSLWITLFFALNIATKDIFLDQTKNEILILWHNFKIPPIYIYWTKWIMTSLTCIIYFTPPIVLLSIIEKNNLIFSLHIMSITPISICLFILINLSTACLFAKKNRKNITFLNPIISIPLTIPMLLFTIHSSVNDFFEISDMFLLCILIFSFPIFSIISSTSLKISKK